MAESKPKTGTLRSFPRLYWVVVMFEFFERGAYYGMMSVLSVYLTDILNFPKESVGTIKGTIQPLLYFLPIISGALADRFGYRRTLMVAFALLGGGYFFTSQMTSYTTVFMALVVMGLGAGAFKPVISGAIARTTDESNSTLGFGIYYWSINLGAFLFPLILVPLLKNNVGWEWVIIASAICTGAMLIPTITLFKDPPMPQEAEARKEFNLIRTVADAFEIVYSPVILVYRSCRASRGTAFLAALLLVGFVALAASRYAAPRTAVVAAPGTAFDVDGVLFEVQVRRDMTAKQPFQVVPGQGSALAPVLVVHRPDDIADFLDPMLDSLRAAGIPATVDRETLMAMVEKATRPPQLRLREIGGEARFSVDRIAGGRVQIRVTDPTSYEEYRGELLAALRAVPELATVPEEVVEDLFQRGSHRPFLLAFIALLVLSAGVILALEPRYKAASRSTRLVYAVVTVAAAGALLWLLPGLSLFSRILSSIIFLTAPSIYLMDFEDMSRFRNHWRFLLLIFLYSGFWVLYFQMFDSVLWYVKAYVDATALNNFVNNTLGAIGLHINWFFDVEHVTVINAGTIIVLQLLVSMIVRKTKALPTMMVGIGLGTTGLAILAINTNIWVFMAGIIVFSIGEMTTHPKFISYVGLTAPRDRVATYMGYIFLYGVIGSSIGAPMGAKLYVHYVDHLNQPRTLWLIFSCIGLFTIAALLLYNKFLAPKQDV
ncbi:MAG: MFS transporter [bacterium]